ncbi:MAG: GNAT family N-acetyltransferase [Candidatus Kariarchaeaceae archaeon]
MTPKSDPLISSDTLLLRYFTEHDLDILMKYRNDPEIARFQGWSFPFTPQDGLQFFIDMQSRSIFSTNDWLQLVIQDTENQILGDCAIRVVGEQAEVGITIRREFQGQGYATAALQLLLQLVFTKLKLHRVITIVDVENVSSQKLMERVGMRKEAHTIESYYDRRMEMWRDEFQYAILATEFSALL